MYEVKRYKRTTRLIFGFLFVLVGLAFARKAQSPSLYYIFPILLVCIFSFRKARLLSLYSLMILGLSVGWWRGSIVMKDVEYANSLAKDKISIRATVLNDAVYDDKKQLSFDVNDTKVLSDNKGIIGKIGISGFGSGMIYRGDKVEVEGKFYPGRGSYTGYISFAKIKVTSRSKSLIYSLSRRFSAGLQNALPEPYASFGLGILIGQRNTLPDNVSAGLSAVGLTHIIAVSGYNLTIIVDSMRRLFQKRSKFQTWLFCQVLIFGFLLVTGFSASIVRAGLISSLSLGAWYYGRSIKPVLILMLSAAATALWNPLYLWSDIGWYLSFFAFFGVLVLSPLIIKRLTIRKEGVILPTVIETVSAQIMTLPLILYIFNTSHFLALPANIFVLPFIPIAMLFSFVSGLFGMLTPSLVGWISWPAKYLLTYIIDVATFFGRVPHMSYSVSFGYKTLIFLYICLLMVTFIVWKKTLMSGRITDINEEN